MIKKIKLFFIVFIPGLIFCVPVSGALNRIFINLPKGRSVDLLKLNYLKYFSSVFKSEKHQAMFFILAISLFVSLVYLIFILPLIKHSEAKTINVLPGLEIPTPAGKYQHGSAKFLSEKEKDAYFNVAKISAKDPYINDLMKKGVTAENE